MKIKLAILDHDKNYIERLVTALNAKFEDKFELYSFTDLSLALPALESARVDLFLAENIFEIAEKDIPQRCGFAYLVTGAGIDTLNGQILQPAADMLRANPLDGLSTPDGVRVDALGKYIDFVGGLMPAVE